MSNQMKNETIATVEATEEQAVIVEPKQGFFKKGKAKAETIWKEHKSLVIGTGVALATCIGVAVLGTDFKGKKEIVKTDDFIEASEEEQYYLESEEVETQETTESEGE